MKKFTLRCVIATFLLFTGFMQAQITSFPYQESFEAGPAGWTASGTNSSWALGTPANTVITGASDGTQAWITNLTGNYNVFENSRVVSPEFSFNGATADPTITMDIWYNSEFSWDGANLQSSVDGGTTWQLVGANGDPNNWYNNGTIDGAPGGSQVGWTGNSGGYVVAEHALTGLAGETSVLLRVNFGSDSSVVQNGFAFDNVRIECPTCPPATGAFPIISCVPDIDVNADAGMCGAIVNFTDALAIDPEDGPLPTTQTMGPASGSSFPVGVTVVQYSVTDSDGNTSTCEFNVTVTDNQLPMAVCQDLTIELDGMGMASIVSSDLDGGSTDNCGIASVVASQTSFSCSDIGDNMVTLTVTDDNGNVSMCTATVTVTDTVAPVIVCTGVGGGNFMAAEDFEGAMIPNGWTTNVLVGTADWEFGSGVTPSGALNDFPTNAAVFDDDAAGIGEVNVSELLSPVYDLDGATLAELSFEYAHNFFGGGFLRAEVWDGAAWQEVLFVDTLVQPTSTGAIDVVPFANDAFQVRFTYDDEGAWSWGAAVDNFLLNVEAPVIANSFEVVLDAMGNATVDPADLVTSVEDGCGVQITVGAPATGGGSTAGSLSTLYAGGNGGGAGGGVYFDITTGAQDVTINSIDINTGEPGAFTMDVYSAIGTHVGNEANAGFFGTPITSSGTGAGAGVPSTAVLDTPLVLAANTTYAIALQLSAAHAFDYTNGDGTNQTYTNGDITINAGAASAPLFTGLLFSPRVFNGGINYTVGTPIDSSFDVDCSMLGENLIEVFVTDAAGNFTSCMASYTVIDETAPVLVCADATIELGPDGTATIDPMALLGTSPSTFNVMTISSDNGSGAEGFTDFEVDVTEAATISFDWDYTTADGAAFDSFGYTINGVYTQLSDPAGGLNQTGNSGPIAVVPGDVFGFRSQSDDGDFGAATTTVTNFMPGYTGQFDTANWTLTLDNSDGDAFFVEIPGGPLSFDACGITTLAVGPITEVSCDDIGTPIMVTVFASDASGNIASCTAMVTVVDTTGPVLTCPADQTQDPGAGNLFYTVPDYFATGEALAEDNCTDPVVITSQDPAPGELLSDDEYTVTLTAEDEYGNVSTCTFTLTVESTLGTGENVLDSAISMYPNPANNLVTITNSSNIQLDKAVIYDVTGKLVGSHNLQDMTGEKSIDISSLASGIYVVQLSSDNASTVKRLIKK